MEIHKDRAGNEIEESETHIPLQRFPSLYLINDTPKGRGVFSREPISQGTIIDVCPVLVFQPDENHTHIAQTQLYHYTYNWPISAAELAMPENHKSELQNSTDTKTTSESTVQQPSRPKTQIPSQALVLGLGSLFNHRSANTLTSTTSSSNTNPSLHFPSDDSSTIHIGPNVGWRRNLLQRTVTYHALREIAAGEELCISYGEKLTFVDADGNDENERDRLMDGTAVNASAEGDGEGMLGRISLGCLYREDGE